MYFCNHAKIIIFSNIYVKMTVDMDVSVVKEILVITLIVSDIGGISK